MKCHTRGVKRLWVLALVACGSAKPDPAAPGDDALEARFPLAKLDDKVLCDALLARTADDYGVTVDPEPQTRRKVIVSDLHLGPGTHDRRFAGIEDFYADAEWSAFLAREAAKGPMDLVINGDFIEFWQIATVLGALPKLDDPNQPKQGAVLAADQAASVQAVTLAIKAHPGVFRAMGQLVDSGDHRVVIVAGNHDADLLWPRVQLAVARAIGAKALHRILFVQGNAYQHAGTYIAHGHEFDAANRFTTLHAPFGRDLSGRCRLQTNWGEVFVDVFYTETERQIPFIDNLYPEKAGILWGLRDNPDLARDLGAAMRAVDLLRAAQGKGLNKDAVGSLLQGTFGTAKKPESSSEVIDHMLDRLTKGDRNADTTVFALIELAHDPAMQNVMRGLVAAAAAIPDMTAALRAVQTIDPAALDALQKKLFGDSMETAAKSVMKDRGVMNVILGHTHSVGGFVKPLDNGGFYANTGSWISVASVADLKARGIGWDQLSILDRATFPSKMTSIVVEYEGGKPRPPVVQNP